MRYVRAGTLRIEFRDMPVFGTQSSYAAEAGRAAAAAGRFWQFYDAIYAAAPPRGHASLTTIQLQQLGRRAGVRDLNDYVTAIKTERYRDEISRDADEAAYLGITTTPSFLINDVPLVGAQPTGEFERIIQEQARQK
jgi:protein-disulfide isomerase